MQQSSHHASRNSRLTRDSPPPPCAQSASSAAEHAEKQALSPTPYDAPAPAKRAPATGVNPYEAAKNPYAEGGGAI